MLKLIAQLKLALVVFGTILIGCLASASLADPISVEQSSTKQEKNSSESEAENKADRIAVADKAAGAAAKLEEQNELGEAAQILQGVVFCYQLELGDSPKLIAALGNCGRVLAKQHKNEDAKLVFARALRICLEHPEYLNLASSSFFDNLGKCFQELSEPMLANDAISYAAAIRRYYAQVGAPDGGKPEAQAGGSVQNADANKDNARTNTPTLSDRLIAFAQNTHANAGPKTTIDAFYEQVDSEFPITTHIICDGKGRIREDRSYYEGVSDLAAHPLRKPNPGKKRPVVETVTSIVDFSKGTVIDVMPKFDPIVSNIVRDPVLYDRESAAKLHARLIGSKDILGHHCSGYHYIDEGQDNVVWVDDKVDFWVRREVSNPDGKKIVMQLKKWSFGLPDLGVFELPAGTKCSPMPAVIPNCTY